MEFWTTIVTASAGVVGAVVGALGVALPNWGAEARAEGIAQRRELRAASEEIVDAALAWHSAANGSNEELLAAQSRYIKAVSRLSHRLGPEDERVRAVVVYLGAAMATDRTLAGEAAAFLSSALPPWFTKSEKSAEFERQLENFRLRAVEHGVNNAV